MSSNRNEFSRTVGINTRVNMFLRNLFFNIGNRMYKSKDYDKMEKYYTLAINRHHLGALCNLTLYRSDKECNYRNIRELYKVIIKTNKYFSMIDSIDTKHYSKEEYDEMEKYYLSIIDDYDSPIQ